jgi:hypothetical protein
MLCFEICVLFDQIIINKNSESKYFQLLATSVLRDYAMILKMTLQICWKKTLKKRTIAVETV